MQTFKFLKFQRSLKGKAARSYTAELIYFGYTLVAVGIKNNFQKQNHLLFYLRPTRFFLLNVPKYET